MLALNYRWLKALNPYWRLGRWHSLIGFWLTYWPAMWGLVLAGNRSVILWLKFTLGALLMRSAGCTYNDLVDRKFDREVRRTKTRPLAQGELTPKQGIVFLAIQLMLAFWILISLNRFSIILGCVVCGLVLIYPWMKRITHWPQLFLAGVFNAGVLLGDAAVNSTLSMPVMLTFGAAGCWTLVYDTVYAHQDIVDDLRIGVKSSAIALGSASKSFLLVMTLVMGAMLMISGMVGFAGMGLGLYSGILVAVIANMLLRLWQLNLHDPNACRDWFLHNNWIGAIITAAMMIGTMGAIK